MKTNLVFMTLSGRQQRAMKTLLGLHGSPASVLQQRWGHEDLTWSSWPTEERHEVTTSTAPKQKGVGGWEGFRKIRKKGRAHKMQNQMSPIWGQMPPI